LRPSGVGRIEQESSREGKVDLGTGPAPCGAESFERTLLRSPSHSPLSRGFARAIRRQVRLDRSYQPSPVNRLAGVAITAGLQTHFPISPVLRRARRSRQEPLPRPWRHQNVERRADSACSSSQCDDARPQRVCGRLAMAMGRRSRITHVVHAPFEFTLSSEVPTSAPAMAGNLTRL
jgi:hypothetical protein